MQEEQFDKESRQWECHYCCYVDYPTLKMGFKSIQSHIKSCCPSNTPGPIPAPTRKSRKSAKGTSKKAYSRIKRKPKPETLNYIVLEKSVHLDFLSEELITIMAIGTNRNKAYPVAFCIPDNEKKTCIRLLIQSIKKRAKMERGVDISPGIVLSDDDTASFNAVKKEFDSMMDHYLCTWHVDRNWRKRIRRSPLAVFEQSRPSQERVGG